MRSSIALLVLSLSALAIASPSADEGSIEKLLERVSGDQQSGNAHFAANGIVKRNQPHRRWVWGTSIIQDDSPTEGLPSAGENANLLPTSYAVNTPGLLTPPTFPSLSTAPSESSAIDTPLAAAAIIKTTTTKKAVSKTSVPSSIVKIVKTTTTAHKTTTKAPSTAVSTAKRSAATTTHTVPKSHKLGKKGLEKKWVWGTSIIQDGDPVDGDVTEAATPVVTLVSPTFPADPAATATIVNTTLIVNSTLTNSTLTDANSTLSAVSPVETGDVLLALSDQSREALSLLEGANAVSSAAATEATGVVKRNLKVKKMVQVHRL